MKERIFVGNKEGELKEDNFLPLLNRYRKLFEDMRIEREELGLSGPSFLDKFEKISGKTIERSTPIFVSKFLKKINNEDLVKLSKELSQDLYILKEVKERRLD